MAAAAAGSCRVWAVVAAVLTLVAVAGGSTLMVFGGPGCTANVTVLSGGSGCQAIDKHGGYYFSFTGRSTARLYGSHEYCSYRSGTPFKVLRGDEWYCQNFTYNSVYIARSAAGAGSSNWDITARPQQQLQ